MTMMTSGGHHNAESSSSTSTAAATPFVLGPHPARLLSLLIRQIEDCGARLPGQGGGVGWSQPYLRLDPHSVRLLTTTAELYRRAVAHEIVLRRGRLFKTKPNVGACQF